VKVKNYKGGKLGQVEFDAAPFGDKVLYRTLKDAVVVHQRNQRQGTLSTKGRSEVAGSGKKPWKQKHTGRARAGDRKSPIWRGGGTVFGPKPRDFSTALPAKARRVALRTAIAGKIKDGELVIVELPKFDAPSSKTGRKLLADLGAPRRALFVLAAANPIAWKSLRNFPGVLVRTARELCAHDVVSGGLVIAESGAMSALVERVGATPETASADTVGGAS
jgi:large subunit ribosomal protein L4